MADDRQSGWELHSKEQREAWRKLSYRERLDWLWQAKQFARKATGAARKPRSR